MRKGSRRLVERREEKIVRSERSNSQRDSQIKVVTNWQHTQESNPAFKRLMSLLLQKGNERKREVNDD